MPVGYQQISKKIQNELQSLQSSVQSCQQSVIQRLSPKMEEARGNSSAMNAVQTEFEEGARRCLKEAEPQLPQLEARIKKILSQA
ncbi:unnamed protein product [Effrenium voratum]|nr:unnamed protein product [Effrenium voratum]